MPKKFGEKLDLTSDGKQLPVPIYGGASVAVPNPEHDGDQKDIRTP
jgi:hypothetical protein